jgi:hypothetical protein
MPLIRGGLVSAGDELVYHQPKKGAVYHAEVTSDGWVQVEGGQQFRKLSPSLRSCVGTQINGWLWVHAGSGKTLRALRFELSEAS